MEHKYTHICSFRLLILLMILMSGFFGSLRFTGYASEIQLPDSSKLTINRKNNHNVTIFRLDAIVKFFDLVLFVLRSLNAGPSFMSISSLVLELWQFSLIRNWPEIRKSEIPPSEFCPISGDWGELGIPNLARMSLIKRY